MAITTKVNIENLDLSDPNNLDKIQLDKSSYSKGLTKSIIFTSIAVAVFFMPVTIGGKSDVLFGFIYNFFKNLLGNFGLWLITGVIVANSVVSFYGKFMAKKDSFLYEYYGHDSILHPFFYLLGAVYAVIYTLHVSFEQFTGPDIIVGGSTGGTVIPAIVVGVAWIIQVGAFFMPFLLSYGGIDFIGSILEPFMRPVFRVPGKSAVDAIASFVSSSSMAVIITSKLYRTNTYTKREATIIATCFSAVSVGFAMLVVKTAGLGEHFIKVYFSSFFIAFVITFFMVRIPPLSKKEDIYHNGRIQTEEDRVGEAKFEKGIFKRGIDRAAKRAYTANSIFSEIKSSLIDGYSVMPKVLSLLSAVGITGLIVAEYTPFFRIIGKVFVPLLVLLKVPNAAEIAPSVPVGIAEMFLPVLLIADKVDVLDIGARYFVTAVSMVQIIFFSETIVVMIATRLPVKLWELVVCFLQRTLIAIPLVALAMHILF
ncbi:YjiH family protein [Anaeromicrobium sediminis]|uniref:Transporter n=1 Tax=Anaeromicrobium sediminis TaxID=1478221 RepID=A0A267MNP5_9FIRM|nr:nucleoside recognition domain-containing protein [Anaeromicrobium sediminis]PAB60453.1 transporter [Anaeromicrobium sediminis]